MKLTDKAAAAMTVPTGKAESIVYDEDLGGFGLRARRGGSMVWAYAYKLGRHGQSRRITLGPVTALSAKRARELASELAMFASVRTRPEIDQKFSWRPRRSAPR